MSSMMRSGLMLALAGGVMAEDMMWPTYTCPEVFDYYGATEHGAHFCATNPDPSCLPVFTAGVYTACGFAEMGFDVCENEQPCGTDGTQECFNINEGDHATFECHCVATGQVALGTMATCEGPEVTECEPHLACNDHAVTATVIINEVTGTPYCACECRPGFGGEACDMCAEGATGAYPGCVPGPVPNATATASCEAGYVGADCDQCADEWVGTWAGLAWTCVDCTATSCVNGRLRVSAHGSCTCACEWGYTGADCATADPEGACRSLDCCPSDCVGSCIFDETTSQCHARATVTITEGTLNECDIAANSELCVSHGQWCEDVVQDTTGDWVCVCTSTGARTPRNPNPVCPTSTPTLDPATTATTGTTHSHATTGTTHSHATTETADKCAHLPCGADQICLPIHVADVGGMDDFECRCHPPHTGHAIGMPADCTGTTHSHATTATTAGTTGTTGATATQTTGTNTTGTQATGTGNGTATPAPTPEPGNPAAESSDVGAAIGIAVGVAVLLGACAAMAFVVMRRSKAKEEYAEETNVGAILDAEMALTKEQYSPQEE